MTTSLIIPIFNRPAYLKQCLETLSRATLPKENFIVVLVNDCSTDQETLKLLSEFELPFSLEKIATHKNVGVKGAILRGVEHKQADRYIILDSDCIVRADFYTELDRLNNYYPDHIGTGFNCTTKNRDGSERHFIVGETENCYFKKSVGGCSMIFTHSICEKYILPALTEPVYNWDHRACIASMADGKPVACVKKSVVQHIGIVSSMGHSSGKERPDVADDFVMEESEDEKEQSEFLALRDKQIFKHINGPSEPPKIECDTRLHLPNVTLVTVNCDKIEGGKKAIEESIKGINFGSVKFLTSTDTDYFFADKIPHIPTVERYSHFITKELYKYIDTDYMLIVQSDGYVKNPAAWTDEFLKYDYIGATWWYNDKNIVGNGGFSLRSKKLMQAVSTDRSIVKFHPEDHHICRTYRLHLERKHGIKFAPAELARKFSIEGYRQKNKTWSGEFGFHGGEVKFPDKPAKPGNPTFLPTNTRKPGIVVFNQPFGLGDFIFCLTLMRDYVKQGYKVIVPVVHQYDNINKHFPDITFINKEMLKIDLERKDEYELNGMRVYPLRWSYEITKVPFRDCMKSKYGMFGQDWHRWRDNCSWVRDTAKEDELFYKVLGLHDGAEYNLVNSMFRSDASGKAVFNVSNGYKNIPLQNIEGFTLFDWSKVIENAMTIHTVSTSINYILEILPLKAKEIHLHIRRPDERNFNNIDFIFTRKYKLHY